MRRRVAALLLLALLAAPAPAPAGPGPGETAPDFVLPTVEGVPRRLSDYRGRPVILTFWAFWCWTWEEVHLAYLDMAEEQGARLVTVSVDCQRTERLRTTGAEGRLPYDCLEDPGSRVSGAWGIRRVPTVVVLDSEGVVLARYEGYPGNREVRRCLEQSRRRPAAGAPAVPPASVPSRPVTELLDLVPARPPRVSLQVDLLVDEDMLARFGSPGEDGPAVARRLLERASLQMQDSFGIELRAGEVDRWRVPPGATDPRLLLARHVPRGEAFCAAFTAREGLFGSGASEGSRALVVLGAGPGWEDDGVAMLCHEASHWFGARDFVDEGYPEPSVMNYRDPRRGRSGGRIMWDTPNRRRIEEAVVRQAGAGG